jgi:hypothetical protein
MEDSSALHVGEQDISEGAAKVVIQGQRIFRHKLLYLNYTTYDLRQDQDIVNPNSNRRDVMLLRAQSADDKPTDNHHHLYGRVLGIYHVNAMMSGAGLESHHWDRFDFLWIRWFKFLEPEQPWTSKRLDTITFPPLNHPNSLSFVDPADVLRACHVIPRFSKGPASASTANTSICAQNKNDWKQYCVNRYVVTFQELRRIKYSPI